METASFSETSPRKYKSGGILVGEDCIRPVYWTWAVCEFVHTAVVCPTINTIFRQLHSRCAQKCVPWNKLSCYPFCGLAVVMCGRRRIWKALVWQLLVAEAVIIGRCFVFLNPLHLRHPWLSCVLCRTAALCGQRIVSRRPPYSLLLPFRYQPGCRLFWQVLVAFFVTSRQTLASFRTWN
jgi:hypothetical protein